MKDLKDGTLYPILERVRQDHTLMLAIRGTYINIYYRGGNILKVEEKGKHIYSVFFDVKYCKQGETLPERPDVIKSRDDAKKWVNALPNLKQIMDFYFSTNSKAEREFQQLVVRENNYSTISNESEYFISDIELADSDIGARFDMLAIQWLASNRKSSSNCRVALIEMKYGDGALGGSAGLLKHLVDIDAFISEKENYEELVKATQEQFNQLNKLELLKYNPSRHIKDTGFKMDQHKPEVIFILANHNPRSTKLSCMLKDEDIDNLEKLEHFDLKFFVATFAGYALHSKCMFTLNEFRELLNNPRFS